jgi:uncharacterized protein (TIGR03792 family)
MTGVQTNDKTLQEPDPPPAVEVLVYEVRASAYETWKAAEHEHWTKAFADRFAFFVGKETWLCPGNEWHRVTVVIFWETVEQWHGIDRAWLEEQERRFAAVVGADNYRLVADGHSVHQYVKISEYR